MSTIFGTSARDSIVGSAGEDTIWAYQGGRDTIQALEGDDFISFDGELNDNDQVDGGDGEDAVRLDGNYLAGLVFTATTMVNVEDLLIDGDGFIYDLTLHDATAAGDRFHVNANALVTGGALILDASAETSTDLIVESKVGADQIITGAGDDTIRPGTGSDVVATASGHDRIYMAEGFDPTDEVDAGSDIDAIYLGGDYAAGLTITAAMATSVENFIVIAGTDYDLAIADDQSSAAGQVFQVYSFSTTGGDIVFDVSAETNAQWTLAGGLSDDTLTGGALGDLLDFSQYTGDHGLDAARGGGGDDVILFDGSLTRDDQVDGGAGHDRLEIFGDYAAGVSFNSTTIRNLEEIVLWVGFDYAFIVGNNNVTADGFTVSAAGLGPGDTLDYDGSAEASSDVVILGGAGDDTLLTGGGDDTLDAGLGDDVLTAGAGDDVLVFGAGLGRDDQVEGGAGFDRLLLEGDYTAGVNFASTTLNGVEQIELAAGFDYVLAPGNNNVDADGFTVNAALLGAADTLSYDGGAESVSDVIVLGGGGADTLIGGDGDDSLHGGASGDSLVGGAGEDTIDGARGPDTIVGGLGKDDLRGGVSATTFVFAGVAESTGPGRDWVDVLKPASDHFDLDVVVTGVDPRVNAGSLSEIGFDASLAAAIGAGQLAAGHAVVYKPNAGGLAGHFFLIVDANGVAGYQAGADYVMEFAAGSNPNAIAVGFFI